MQSVFNNVLILFVTFVSLVACLLIDKFEMNSKEKKITNIYINLLVIVYNARNHIICLQISIGTSNLSFLPKYIAGPSCSFIC